MSDLNEMKITVKELGMWARDNAPYSPKVLQLDLEDGRIITWDLEPRTGAYILRKEKVE